MKPSIKLKYNKENHIFILKEVYSKRGLFYSQILAIIGFHTFTKSTPKLL